MIGSSGVSQSVIRPSREKVNTGARRHDLQLLNLIEIPKDHLFFLSIFKGVHQHHQYPVYMSCLAILIIPCRSLTTRMIAVAACDLVGYQSTLQAEFSLSCP